MGDVILQLSGRAPCGRLDLFCAETLVGFGPVKPLSLILLCLAGWINREQQDTIDYLQEEIKVLKEILGKKPRFTDWQC